MTTGRGESTGLDSPEYSAATGLRSRLPSMFLFHLGYGTEAGPRGTRNDPRVLTRSPIYRGIFYARGTKK